MNEPAIYHELDLKIERLLMDCNLSPTLESAAIDACKKEARKMIESGEFTADEITERMIKKSCL